MLPVKSYELEFDELSSGLRFQHNIVKISVLQRLFIVARQIFHNLTLLFQICVSPAEFRWYSPSMVFSEYQIIAIFEFFQNNTGIPSGARILKN